MRLPGPLRRARAVRFVRTNAATLYPNLWRPILNCSQPTLKCRSQKQIPLLPGGFSETPPVLRYYAALDCFALASRRKIKATPYRPVVPPGYAVAAAALVCRAIGPLLEIDSGERFISRPHRVAHRCFNNECLHKRARISRHIGKAESCFWGEWQIVRLRAANQQHKDQSERIPIPTIGFVLRSFAHGYVGLTLNQYSNASAPAAKVSPPRRFSQEGGGGWPSSSDAEL